MIHSDLEALVTLVVLEYPDHHHFQVVLNKIIIIVDVNYSQSTIPDCPCGPASPIPPGGPAGPVGPAGPAGPGTPPSPCNPEGPYIILIQ